MEAAVRLAATDATVDTLSDTSVESAPEMAVSLVVSDAAMLVKLDATDDTAVERTVVSVASYVEMLFSLVTPLAVSEMLELVWSSVAISPSVSSADGAVPIRVLIAVLIALLRLPISAVSAFCREVSTTVNEFLAMVMLSATDATGISFHRGMRRRWRTRSSD